LLVKLDNLHAYRRDKEKMVHLHLWVAFII